MEPVDIEMLVEDGLEIDFGLGVAQHEQAPRKDITNGASLKAAGLAASPRQAPSEINYDTDAQDSVDTDVQDSVNANAPPPARIPTTTTSSGLGNTNDEITWDDPEDDVQLPNVAIEFDEDINDVQSGTGAAQEDEGQEGAFHAVCPPAAEPSVQYIEQDGLEVHDDAVNVEQYEGDYQYSLDGSDILTGGEVDEISQDDLVDQVQEDYPDEADNHSDAPVIEINDNSAEDEEATHDEAPTAETDEADYDDIEVDLSPPEVRVRFAGNDYLLFRDAHDPSRQHILEDSYVQAKASDLLDALHDSLGDEIADGDELIVQVEDLCLEISPVCIFPVVPVAPNVSSILTKS